jgi:acetylornithine/succinyldiaminopimelate/putrescine aminotransferase
MTTKQRDRKYLGRNDEPDDLEITRAEGNHVFDVKGRRYIDFTSGWCVGNLGWGDAEIRKQLRRFDGPAYVTPSSLYAPWADFAELIVKLAPVKRAKCFRATGGSETVDLALQAAMLHTQRGKFLAREGSYHGNSLAGISIAATDDRKSLPNFLRGGEKLPAQLDAKALPGIEARLNRHDVAAIIMEPVSINLGVMMPDPEVMVKLQRLCRRTGTLLIMDEVACGFGRTGRLFASELLGIEPDILCLAKALTGGHAAMGAAIMTGPVARSMEEAGSFYSTFGWHPYSVHAALANLRYWRRHRNRILRHVGAMGDLFRARLGKMEFVGLKDMRVQGLAIALEFESKGIVSRLEEACQKKGLLVTDAGEEILLLLPPLNVEPRVAERGLDILEGCL